MGPHVWLIPVGAGATRLDRSVAVLRRHRLNHDVVNPDQVRARLEHELPAGALLHGGPVTPLLMDVQRWLADAGILTMVLLEDRTGYYENILRDRGVHEVLSLPVSRRTLGAKLEVMTQLMTSVVHLGRRAPPVSVGHLTILPSGRVATTDRSELRLTKSEFDLLLALAGHQGTVVSRADLALATGERGLTDRALESHISRLRSKLCQTEAGLVIHAHRGVGYTMRPVDPPALHARTKRASSARS